MFSLQTFSGAAQKICVFLIWGSQNLILKRQKVKLHCGVLTPNWWQAVDTFDLYPFLLLCFSCVWTVHSLLTVHRRSNIWWGEGHVHSLPEFKETENRHFSEGQRWRMSCQPASSLGTGYRHPESLAAGLRAAYISNTLTWAHTCTFTHTLAQMLEWHVG